MRGTDVSASDAGTVIEFNDVSKIYRSLPRPFPDRTVRAVADFSLRIAPGEVLGIAGPNGAGKSTVIALLLGYLRPTQGTVRIQGDDPRVYVERHGVGYLSELISIRPRWTAEGALRRFAVLAGVAAHEVEGRVDTAIARLGLEEHRAKAIRALSKGNLQRVGLAQALLRDERILILDEPTHGLDPVWTQRFRDIVGQLRRADRIIVIASHNLDELQRLADRVAIMDHGKLQRVVQTGGTHGASAGTETAYHLTVSSGGELVREMFANAVDEGRGEFTIAALPLVELNRGIAQLIARGAIVTALVPAHSALEQHFREVVGESA